jgi:hypothetical protein
MSTLASPFGLRPSFHEGSDVEGCVLQTTIASGYGTAIGLYDAIKFVAGVLQRAAAGDAFVGSFEGVEYDDPVTGRHVVSNQWPANLVATNIVAYYTKEPYLTYEIQATGTVTQSQVGAQANILATAPTIITGLSNESLDIASITTSANAQLRITGITPGPDNAFGDPFTIVQVQVSKHQYVAVVNAIA